MIYEALWLRAFALTLGVELVVAVPLLRPTGGSWARRVGAVALANLASHPLVWFFLRRVMAPGDAFAVVAEGWAVASEAAVYALVFPGAGVARAVAASALANAVSFTLGIVVSAVF